MWCMCLVQMLNQCQVMQPDDPLHNQSDRLCNGPYRASALFSTYNYYGE